MNDERIPLGTKVKYHGSIGDYYGEYEVTAYSDFTRREQIFTREVLDEHYTQGYALDLWPVGVLKKFGNRHLALYFVRPESVTVMEDDD